MLRTAPVLVSALLLAMPAWAQDGAASKSRYQIVPQGEGFVRLDTETGALTHCTRSDGVWRCTIIVDDRNAIDGRIAALKEEMAALRADVAALAQRLAAVEGEPDAAGDEAPDGGLSEREEQEFDEALSFAERMMQRFFDMIRELKDEQPPQRI